MRLSFRTITIRAGLPRAYIDGRWDVAINFAHQNKLSNIDFLFTYSPWEAHYYSLTVKLFFPQDLLCCVKLTLLLDQYDWFRVPYNNHCLVSKVTIV